MKSLSEPKLPTLSDSQSQLVIENRTSAHRIAHRLRRRYCPTMDAVELESLADLCLCEAALVYDSGRGTQLLTLFYAFVWRKLAEELRGRKRHARNTKRAATNGADVKFEEDINPELASPDASPEEHTSLKEFSERCQKAAVRLTPLEKLVVYRVQVQAEKVAQVARSMGYSRGHLSTLQGSALRKLRSELVDFRDAA